MDGLLLQLCFFLVEDDNLESDQVSYHGFSYHELKNLSVLTTMDVPWQRRCSDPTLQFILCDACRKLTGSNLPVELVAHIASLMDVGLSREKAEDHRRQLMNERKVAPKDPEEVSVKLLSVTSKLLIVFEDFPWSCL
jgi:hypothetical protein